MGRRTVAPPRRVHVYRKSETVPGACVECPLPKRNAVHCEKNDPRLIAQQQAQAEHRRRAGDPI